MPLLTGEPVAGAGTETTSTLLGGVVIAFSGALEASAGRRQALKRLVTTNGGRIVYILSKQLKVAARWYQVTHLVVGGEDVDELLRQQQQDQVVDSRVRKAQELGLQVVSDRWLLDSVAACSLLDDIPYSFSWKQRMLLQGLSVDTRPEEYCLNRLVAGMRDIRVLGQAVGFGSVMKSRTSSRSQQQLVPRPHHGATEPSWAVSLRAKREQLLTERKLEKERKRREEKERKRQEVERLRQREREGQQDWKRYRAQRSQERRDDQRIKKLERLEANWCEERVRIEARAREKRKEKVIRMILWEQRKIDERTKELRDIKRAQDTKEARLALWEEWERKKSVWRRQEAFESGRKIFVGGFKFDDVADEGETKARFIVEKRKEHLRALFASFGPVLALREQWAKEFVFVLYKEPEDAARAFAAIRDSERRRSMVALIERGLIDNGEPSVYAPSPSFYVRWPRQKYAGRRSGGRSPTKVNDEQQQRKKKEEEEEAKRKEEAKEKKKREKKERKKREREERKEKRKSEKRAVVEQMKARGEKTTPAAIGRQMKKMKKNESGGQPQITKATKPTSDTTKKMTSNGKPKSQTKKKTKNEDAGAKQDRETKINNKQTKKKKKENGDGQPNKPANKITEKKDSKKPTTKAPTTASERREKRERELAELRAKSLEELEDALDVLQCGRRELIRGWRRGWETPDETRRWHRLLFEKEKKRRRLQREAERLQRKREELDRRRLARFEARKRERLEQREREANEARQRVAEIRRRIEEGSERERQRRRDEALEAKRLRNECERARVALEIARVRAALRLEKNRRRRARKRDEARQAAVKEAARLDDLRRQEEERRGKPTTSVVAVAAASSAQRPESAQERKNRAGGRKDDSWIVAAFALLCVLVFACAVYL